MNWAAISFDWNQVRAFLATAEEGSLSAAARALGQTQPTIGRQVAALEEALGVVLFERVGRSLSVTPAGMELLDHVRAMGEAAGRLSLAASGRAQSVEGIVRITAVDLIAAYILPPVLARLRKEAPNLEIEIVATNDIRDLQQREADIAIRHVRPDQPDLIAKLLFETEAHFYASNQYISRMGALDSLEAMARADFISFGDPEEIIASAKSFGLLLTRRNFGLGSRTGMVAWEMVRRGLGVGIMADGIAAQSPAVVPLLPEIAGPTFPFWLTTHRELHKSRRIRLVFDMLDEFLVSEERKRLNAIGI